MALNFLTLDGVSVQLGGASLLDHLTWHIHRGEQWAVIGPSGSGKTVLAHTLLGKHFASGKIHYHFANKGTEGHERPRIAVVEQQHKFKNRPGATELYYQQRFNSSDADQTMTVAQELTDAGWDGGLTPEDDILLIRPLLQKPLIQLSNGENKRTQLAIALLEKPELLILDNPFLGLDKDMRVTLHRIINQMAAAGMQIILITSPNELPDSITHVGQLEKGKWTYLGPRSGFQPPAQSNSSQELDPQLLGQLKEAAGSHDFSIAVKMVNTTIKYGDATILDQINWEVKKGEKWNVSGPNGAGKSTILSLITADNPQAYANEIWLFDRRRGSGESIWDIKKKIGFVSPELHLYFEIGATAFEVIASGLFDTIGLFRQLSPEQEATVLLWMKLLSLEALRSRRLTQLSTGQQRMVLLARALIKNPPMLILDEPCQGLDDEQTAHFRQLVTILCETFDTTLIYVSHYRQELPECINHFLALEKGRIASLV